MNQENKIKVNDLPDESQDAPEVEIELPVLDDSDNRGGHSEGGCCGACGG